MDLSRSLIFITKLVTKTDKTIINDGFLLHPKFSGFRTKPFCPVDIIYAIVDKLYNIVYR